MRVCRVPACERRCLGMQALGRIGVRCSVLWNCAYHPRKPMTGSSRVSYESANLSDVPALSRVDSEAEGVVCLGRAACFSGDVAWLAWWAGTATQHVVEAVSGDGAAHM